MIDYTSESPEFSTTISIVETTDPAHADNINASVKQLMQNTLSNRELIEQTAEAIGTADAYDDDVKYTVGETCEYNGIIYICISSTSGEFDSDCWEEISIVALKEQIDSVEEAVDKLGNDAETAEDAFKRYYGLAAQTTTIASDGTVTAVNDEATVYVEFGKDDDGNKTITETMTLTDGSAEYVKVTTIIEDSSTGSKTIKEVYSENELE